jgi:hypothetical protein
MEKILVEICKGNDNTLLGTFDVDEKEKAFEHARSFNDKYTPEDGLITVCIYNVDENGNKDGKGFKLLGAVNNKRGEEIRKELGYC